MTVHPAVVTSASQNIKGCSLHLAGFWENVGGYNLTRHWVRGLSLRALRHLCERVEIKLEVVLGSELVRSPSPSGSLCVGITRLFRGQFS